MKLMERDARALRYVRESVGGIHELASRPLETLSRFRRCGWVETKLVFATSFHGACNIVCITDKGIAALEAEQ